MVKKSAVMYGVYIMMKIYRKILLAYTASLLNQVVLKFL